MTPQAFVAKWHDNPLSERAGDQPFFLDLCELLGVEKPNDPDNYCFERGATRTGAGPGWADVWKRCCFAWESKAPGRNLGDALKQLMTYALALGNLPLLVVSGREIKMAQSRNQDEYGQALEKMPFLVGLSRGGGEGDGYFKKILVDHSANTEPGGGRLSDIQINQGRTGNSYQFPKTPEKPSTSTYVLALIAYRK